MEENTGNQEETTEQFYLRIRAEIYEEIERIDAESEEFNAKVAEINERFNSKRNITSK